jgi:hypothetical protein
MRSDSGMDCPALFHAAGFGLSNHVESPLYLLPSELSQDCGVRLQADCGGPANAATTVL